jgi:hypothetical protein
MGLRPHRGSSKFETLTLSSSLIIWLP